MSRNADRSEAGFERDFEKDGPRATGGRMGWLSLVLLVGGGSNGGQAFGEVVELAREIGFGDSPRKA